MTPTVLTVPLNRIDRFWAPRLAIPAAVLAIRPFWSTPIDIGTGVAMGILGAVVIGGCVLWWQARRRPSSMIVAYDEIRAEPPGAHPELRRIYRGRSSGAIRLRRGGRRLGLSTVLTGTVGDAQVPLGLLDIADVLDACEAHGWTVLDD